MDGWLMYGWVTSLVTSENRTKWPCCCWTHKAPTILPEDHFFVFMSKWAHTQSNCPTFRTWTWFIHHEDFSAITGIKVSPFLLLQWLHSSQEASIFAPIMANKAACRAPAAPTAPPSSPSSSPRTPSLLLPVKGLSHSEHSKHILNRHQPLAGTKSRCSNVVLPPGAQDNRRDGMCNINLIHGASDWVTLHKPQRASAAAPDDGAPRLMWGTPAAVPPSQWCAHTWAQAETSMHITSQKFLMTIFIDVHLADLKFEQKHTWYDTFSLTYNFIYIAYIFLVLNMSLLCKEQGGRKVVLNFWLLLYR